MNPRDEALVAIERELDSGALTPADAMPRLLALGMDEDEAEHFIMIAQGGSDVVEE